MRTKAIVLIVLLCTTYINNLFGQDNYLLINKSDTKADIEVSGDVSIIVAKLVPDTIHIYGDVINNVYYGGDVIERFQKHQVKPNANVKGVVIVRENDGIKLQIDYNELSDKATIALKIAFEKREGDFTPEGGVFIISITKGEASSIGSIPDEKLNSDLPITPEWNRFYIKKLLGKVDSLENKKKEQIDGNNFTEIASSYPKWLLLLGFILLLLFSYFLHKRNRSTIKKLKQEKTELHEKVKLLSNRMNKLDERKNIQPQEVKHPDTMTRDEIQTFVVSQIRSLLPQIVTPVSNSGTPIQEPERKPVASSVLDTDQVKYHSDSNSFTIENVDNPVFRIYEKGNVFYYTIVDDIMTRKELVGIIPSYAGCITYQTIEGEASSIEPVNPGKLYKDGNRFVVDANNKLAIRFVK